MTILIRLRRNGQHKGYAVSVESWQDLEMKALDRFDDLKNYVGPLEFRDETHKLINEFRVPLSDYSRQNVWVCLPQENWIELQAYRCPRCGDTLVAHNCCITQSHRNHYNRPMLPVEALVIAVEKLFSSKKS